MITPEYLEEIMLSAIDSMDNVSTQILIKLAERLATAFLDEEKSVVMPTTINELHRLVNMGILTDEIERQLKRLIPYAENEIKQLFDSAVVEISNQNTESTLAIAESIGFESEQMRAFEIIQDTSNLHKVDGYLQVGVSDKAKLLDLTPNEVRRIESAYARTMGTFHNLTRTTAVKTSENFINACDNAFNRVRLGNESPQTAVIDAISECAKKGITTVAYPTGHTDKLEVAVARAVRTGINQSSGDVVLTRCAEIGVGYVRTTAHMGARVTPHDDYTNHSWWQGKVYSLNMNNPLFSDIKERASIDDSNFGWLNQLREDTQKSAKVYNYPDFYECTGYGDIQGLCGINCRHSFFPFYPESQDDTPIRIDEKKNEKTYRDTQKQRAMERNIRATKKDLQMLKALKSNDPEIKDRIKFIRGKLARQSEEYMKFCEDNGLKPRNQALKTGRE